MKKTVLLLVSLFSLSAHGWAFDAAENDQFFIGFGSSNIEETQSQALIAGSNVFGGLRLGLVSTLFMELGYGAITYQDNFLENGVAKEISFRTTGPSLGVGFLVPLRSYALGFRATRWVSNRWAEEVTNLSSPVAYTESNVSGPIDFNSGSIFGRFAGGHVEVGVRRDLFTGVDTRLKNSFGVYLAFAW